MFSTDDLFHFKDLLIINSYILHSHKVEDKESNTKSYRSRWTSICMKYKLHTAKLKKIHL